VAPVALFTAGVPYALRAASAAELPAILDLLERAFPEAERALFERQTLADSTFRLRHGRVAVTPDGRVLGYARIFARTMLVRGAPVPAGGIGSVATAPDARGRGIATALLRDALAVMRDEGMRLSFLFTGIPAFYGRLGYRVVRQPYIDAPAAAVRRLRPGADAAPRPLTPRDIPDVLGVYRSATAAATGAVVRTPRAWREASAWLGDDGWWLAGRSRRPVAYVRARCRPPAHQLLEAHALPGYGEALAALLAHSARCPAGCRTVTALCADGSPLARLLAAVRGARVSWDFRWPMMVRGVGREGGAPTRAFGREPLAFSHADRI